MKCNVDITWFAARTTLTLAFPKAVDLSALAVKKITETLLYYEELTPWKVTTREYKTSTMVKGKWHPTVSMEINPSQPTRDEGVMKNELTYVWDTPFYVTPAEIEKYRMRTLVLAGLMRDKILACSEVQVHTTFRCEVVRY